MWTLRKKDGDSHGGAGSDLPQESRCAGERERLPPGAGPRSGSSLSRQLQAKDWG